MIVITTTNTSMSYAYFRAITDSLATLRIILESQCRSHKMSTSTQSIF